MSAPCATCKKNVTHTRFPGLSCAACNKVFHITCANLNKQIFENIEKAALAWNCNNCKKKSTTRKSGIFPQQSSSKASTAKETATPQPDNSSEIKQTLDNLRKDFETYKKLTEEKINTLEEKLREIQSQNTNFATSLSNIEGQVTESTKKENENLLTIQGIPENLLDDATEAVLNVAKQIGCKLSQSDFDCTISNSRKKIATVEFKSKSKRRTFYQAGKKFNRENKRLSANNSQHKIFINEFLTGSQKQLLYNTKVFARENNYRHSWFCNGLVHLKKSDHSRLIVLETQLDLDCLIENAERPESVLPERSRTEIQD